MSYVVTKGPDGTSWVSLEPLMNDLKEAIITLMDMTLPLEEEEGRNQKLLGLKASYEILGAIVQESNLHQAKHSTLQ